MFTFSSIVIVWPGAIAVPKDQIPPLYVPVPDVPVRLTPAGRLSLTVTPVAVNAEIAELVTDKVYLPVLADVAPKVLVRERSANGGGWVIYRSACRKDPTSTPCWSQMPSVQVPSAFSPSKADRLFCGVLVLL